MITYSKSYKTILKRCNKCCLILFLALTFIADAFSQEIYFRNISNLLNLPSQECYNVMQDSKGYVWICTENGLVKYSKNKSLIFNKQNGLDENSVYFIWEDDNGAINLLSSANRMLTVENDSVKVLPNSHFIQNHLKNRSKPRSFDVGYFVNYKNQNKLIINSQQQTFSIDYRTNKIEDLSAKNQYQSDAFLILVQNDDEAYFIKNNLNSIADLPEKGYIRILLVNGANRKELKVSLEMGSRLDWRNRICTLNGYTYFILHNILLQIDEQLNAKLIPFQSVITAIYLNENHGLWIGTSANGVYHYTDAVSLNNFTHGLNGLTVSSIFIDSEGGTWCTTTEKGVFYSGNYNILYYPDHKEMNKKTTFMKAMNDYLFFSTEIDKLVYLDGNGPQISNLINTGNGEITDVCKFKNKLFISNKAYLGILNDRFQIKEIVKTKDNLTGNITSYQLDKSNKFLYVLTAGAVFRLDENEERLTPGLLSKGRCFKVISDSLIYVGGSEGLYRLKPYEQRIEKVVGIDVAVSKILQTQKGKVYCTTRGQGLFRIDGLRVIKIPLSIESMYLNDMVEDKNQTIWIAGNDGLFKLNDEKGGYSSQRFSTSNGLISNSLIHLGLFNNELYLSSPEGICKFPVNVDLSNNSPPRFYLKLVTINDSIHLPEALNYDFSYWQNNVTFSFDQICFRGGEAENLIYRLVGIDEDFQTATSNQIQFENLPPGAYELDVQLLNSDGVRSEEPLKIKFTISPPFWITWWFRISVFILFGGLVYFYVRRSIAKIKYSEAEKTWMNQLISESQLSALQAQMNPHFIFNAINSIQNYILDKREEDAYDYLVKFSKLVRLVLNNSRQKELSLASELEMLGLYVELEQLRFDNSFEYTVTISPEVNIYETELPSMLIQPYVENAIWHGLMNLGGERKGVLRLEFKKSRDFLLVSIEDNGIGRGRSGEFKKDALHHSVGMKLTEKRIEILNKIWNSKNIQVNVIDLYDESNMAIGTRVELTLPLSLQ